MSNKTLIVTGSFCLLDKGVKYDVYLFGQSNENIKCQVVGRISGELKDYDTLIEMAKNSYSKYFNTDTSDLDILTDWLVNTTKDY